MRVLQWAQLSDTERSELRKRNTPLTDELLGFCREIFSDIAARGDRAVLEWGARFDGVAPDSLWVSGEEFEEARALVREPVREALAHAARNLERFHRSQLHDEPRVEVEPGVLCWREVRPIRAVGLYVPGGTAALPSTALMLGIPARLAGCPLRVLCTPPNDEGRIPPEVLVAARLAGVTGVIKAGGAQAIAALALGTESIPAVDKIFGPGNRYVQAAKLVAGFDGVGVDMVAGPSELMVVADGSASPRLVAADLISQAEHGADSQVVLVTDSATLAERVLIELKCQLGDLPRQDLAGKAIEHGFILVTPGIDEALLFAGEYAPEHLSLQIEGADSRLDQVTSAGSVFLGPWSPETAGDYASGTNHSLPTSGCARWTAGVSVDSFLRRITVQRLDEKGLRRLAPTLLTLAQAEGLEGHRRAVACRLSEQGAG